MQTVFKYPLRNSGISVHHLPIDPKFLTVGFQGSQLVLWAEVRPTAPTKEYKFYTALTGGIIDEQPGCIRRYIGTAQLDDGGSPFVVHVYVYFPENELG